MPSSNILFCHALQPLAGAGKTLRSSGI